MVKFLGLYLDYFKKIKNYLIIGNRFYLNYKSKNENSIGSFLVELEEYKTPIYFENKINYFV